MSPESHALKRVGGTKGKKKIFPLFACQGAVLGHGYGHRLRLNSIDYTFHFPKCHLPEGAGGVFGIHLADVLAMWLSASAGSSHQFTVR